VEEWKSNGGSLEFMSLEVEALVPATRDLLWVNWCSMVIRFVDCELRELNLSFKSLVL
jgi:hypothetical protein